MYLNLIYELWFKIYESNRDLLNHKSYILNLHQYHTKNPRKTQLFLAVLMIEHKHPPSEKQLGNFHSDYRGSTYTDKNRPIGGIERDCAEESLQKRNINRQNQKKKSDNYGQNEIRITENLRR